MFSHSIDPVFLHLGPLAIKWYGLIYAFGFVITYFLLKHFIKKKGITLKEDDLDTFMFYLIIGVVLGSRIFEILFYQPAYYFTNPLKMVAIWQGGLSFHGGLVGACIATFLFCRKRNFSFFVFADMIVLPAALALGLGRLGNFLNGELVGRVTSVPWAVKFQNFDGFRHPSQLYESFKNFFIFAVLWFLKDTKRKPGFLFALFLILYGSLRFLVEFVREPEVIIFSLTMGQWLSIPLIVVGIFLLKK